MFFQILINIVITFVWMFLYSSWDLPTFIVGYLVGIVLLLMLRRFFDGPLYIRKLYRFFILSLILLRELILANIAVVKQVFKPKLTIKPGVFALKTDLNSDWEVTLLANLITLTPGTVTVDISPDQRTLYIHALDIDDIDEAVTSIKDSFEKAIMEVSR